MSTPQLRGPLLARPFAILHYMARSHCGYSWNAKCTMNRLTQCRGWQLRLTMAVDGMHVLALSVAAE